MSGTKHMPYRLRCNYLSFGFALHAHLYDYLVSTNLAYTLERVTNTVPPTVWNG